MPSILNLKFKGNKSFVAFSNLGEADALTKTWKVCTKVAGFLEQGQRLENLSWRLWHLQNLMVDTDNARSKREFKKLSKVMGDKLDKEKGRSIADLEAPGFRRNTSTDMIQQRAVEKERNREASQNARPGTIKRNMFTFAVEQPAALGPAPVGASKPDYKPSAEFAPTGTKRKAAPAPPTLPQAPPPVTPDVDMGTPLTQRGRKASISAAPALESSDSASSDWASEAATLRFPSLFSSDFGPTALLNPLPTVRGSLSYGEGLAPSQAQDSFAVPRPTLELPLDDILSTLTGEQDPFALFQRSVEQDITMHPPAPEPMLPFETSFDSTFDGLPLRASASPPTVAPAALAPMSPPQLPRPMHERPVKSISPTKMSSDRPRLTLKTSASRSAGPSATATASSTKQSSAPGGVKGECSNCGATHTPLWRRGLNDELNCNACGLYCKLHKRPRPKSMRNSHGGESRASHSAARAAVASAVVSAEAPETPSASAGFSGRARSASTASILGSGSAQCYNCHTTTTPLWRKDDEGKTVCNACGLYFKLHGSARPISMKSDVIRKRSRHDARRAGGPIEQTPSTSPGASRRASPANDNAATPTFAPDSTTQTSGYDYDYSHTSQSELMNALTGNSTGYTSSYSLSSYTSGVYPGPWNPELLKEVQPAPAEALPFSGVEQAEADDAHDQRASKRRRMSNVSTVSSGTEPPLSAASYGSYDSGFGSGSSSLAGSGAAPLPQFPYASYSSFNLMRGSNPTGGFWPAAARSPATFVHPPMLPPDDGAMDYASMNLAPVSAPAHHGHDETDYALFSTYLHPPMLPPDSPQHGLATLQPQHHLHQHHQAHLHPPMLPPDFGGGADVFNESGIASY